MGLLDGAGTQAGTAAVQAALAALPGIEKFTDAERSQLTQDIAAIVQQASAVVQADLKPALDESAAWRGKADEMLDLVKQLLTTGIEANIGGLPVTIRAAQPKPVVS